MQVNQFLLPLQVTAIERQTADIVTFTLAALDRGELPSFTPGAHLQVQTPSGVARKYSINNAATRSNHYDISVKREAHGNGGSRSMIDELTVGAIVHCAPPENAFALMPSLGGYLFIAGGIGITPILSMIDTLSANDSSAQWSLIYLTRNREETAFYDVLDAHANATNIHIHHDDGEPSNAYDLWPALESPTSAQIYCCGPRRLMDDVRDMTGHWPMGSVHFESFIDGNTARADDHAFKVKLAKRGLTIDVPVGMSILSALRANGCEIASSCESGSCGTCRTTLVAGEAEHRDFVLLPEEFASQIMICVSRAKSDLLTLDL